MSDNTIRFLLGMEVRTLVDIDPNTTVLQYLRDGNDHRSTLNYRGTKEGCASGDCGACTVVVGELDRGKLRYRSINACISLIASLHGKQLVVVENLKQANGHLHPVQQSLVDEHGSQCGFCTPGIVMSLYALQKNHPQPSRQQVLTALSGNLCRCTGYRPIIEAALQMSAPQAGELENPKPNGPAPHELSKSEQIVIKKLQQFEQAHTVTLSNGPFHYFAPATVDELARLYAENPQARLLAGGTDLTLEITQQHQDLETIIDVSRVQELKTITETPATIDLGSAVTYSECSERLIAEYPDLGEMLERLGSLQIRNRGTLGGNIGNASPIGDMPPVLIALGANITLRQGNRTRSVKVEDFFVDYKVTLLEPAEFIERIEIPKARPTASLKIYKISKRLDDDISSVLGAFHLCINDGLITEASIAYGGMAATPRRASHCEAALVNQPFTEHQCKLAMAALEQDFTPLTDVRASAHYRMQVAKNLLYKCFLELSEPGSAIRISHYA